MLPNKLYLIGCASGIAGVDAHSGEGPLAMQKSHYLLELTKQGIPFHWDAMIQPFKSDPSLRVDEAVRNLCEELAKKVSELVRRQQFFSVIGGDHSCAIGTWSGVYDAIHDQGDIGLIWIDAHMDSHTPETTPSGRIHGMPLAALLGYGYPTLTSILHDAPKIKPENLCLIGVRSFERGEAELLQRLHVRIYFMNEVKQRGFTTVLHEAIDRVNHNTIGYGLTLDMDSIDPEEAPGVDVPESNGIHVKDLLEGLSEIVSDSRLITTEIVEFDPSRDKDHMTEKLIVSLLRVIAKGKKA